MTSMYRRIADELGVNEHQVRKAAELLDEGATVPFIARYRKEVTGGLDDTQMRHLEERLRYLRELEERRAVIVKSIEEQGKLTDELAAALAAADTKTRLEDLYLPYKPKRRTKGQIAREAGLEPLADSLYNDPALDPQTEAAKYLNGEGEEGAKVTTAKQALEGAKYILMERFAEDAELLGTLREYLAGRAQVSARLVQGKAEAGAKFRDYFSYDEALKKVPSHRALAIFRGRNEGCLSLSLTVGDPDNPPDEHPCEKMVAGHWRIRDQGRPADPWLMEVVRWTWRIKLLPHLETDLFTELRERAEAEAINVFAANLKALLLAAPAGQQAAIGLDPGLRTGVKVAVVDTTGKVLEHGAIFPNPPQKRTREAEAALVAWCKKHNVKLIAIGNGTAGRETDAFVGAALKAHPELSIQKVMVNESGASVYSASETAAKEFPNLDVTVRGAISIARRLQDPLAELVKIEPRSIGVGQYQHDVSQSKLARALEGVVEDCVNAVGVEVNT
ncbi:MAG TPA: Tex-like N-terminal domain-containing protein, partial [Gammaproteobacteria bacterium]|nr:Tex-like N-terminal domain-containing protein [Gammaproteobacteria bacterium]